MSYSSHLHTEPARKNGHTPWLLFLFLAAVFFSSYHDLAFAKRGFVAGVSAEDISARIADGSPAREIAVSALGLFAILSLARNRTGGRLRIAGPLGWLLLGFVVWAFISSIWAQDLPLTLKRLGVFGIFCIAAVTVVRLLSLREIILWTLFSTAVFLFIDIVAAVVFGTFQPFIHGYRFAGTLHPNSEGVECGLLLLSAVAAENMEKRRRIVFRTCALLGLLFLILSGSRTALAAITLALIVYFFSVCSMRGKIIAAFAFSIVFCSLLLFFGAGLLPDLQSAIKLGRADPGTVDSFHGRTMLWKDVGYYIHQRPLLGYGYGGFWTPPQVSRISEEEGWTVPNGHSAYIDNLLDLGVVGFVAYALLLFAGIWRAFRFHRLSQNSGFAFCGALLVFCAVDGFLESASVEGSLLMFLSMIVLARLAIVPFHKGSEPLRVSGFAAAPLAPAERIAK